jgi:hypothetical protein
MRRLAFLLALFFRRHAHQKRLEKMLSLIPRMSSAELTEALRLCEHRLKELHG